MSLGISIRRDNNNQTAASQGRFMKYLFLIFLYLALTACGGGNKSEGSSESTRTASVGNWPNELSVNEDEQLSYDPKVQSNLEGGMLFHGENMPDWIQVNPSTGALSGVPTNDDSGQEYSDLKIIANNGGRKALEIGPFTIEVVAVNDAPEIEPQTL